MCELFGYSSSVKSDLINPLNVFFKHSITNPDGFGIRVLDKESKIHLKQPMPAVLSTKLQQLLGAEFRASTCIAHIRYATQGKRSVDNCHPFSVQDITGRRWTLAHNGFIKDSKETEKFKSTQQGETDSERLLLYIVSCINKRQMSNALKCVKHQTFIPISQAERIKVVETAVNALSKLGKVNLLIYDGTLFYEFSNMPNTLHQTKYMNGMLFATKPVSAGTWSKVPLARLQVFKEGVLLHIGTDGTVYNVPSKAVDISCPDNLPSRQPIIKPREGRFYAPTYARNSGTRRSDVTLSDPFYVGEDTYPCFNQYGEIIGYKKR